MAKLTRLSPEQRENLTAYLDGELEESKSLEIEQVLADSPVARHEVEMLSRAWDLLNVLPSTKATDEFSRKTLSSLRAADEPRSKRTYEAIRKSTRRGLVLALWGMALGLCAFVGFEATRNWVPNEHDELLDDFDVINNYDAYSIIGDSRFLKLLAEKRTFPDDYAPDEKQP